MLKVLKMPIQKILAVMVGFYFFYFPKISIMKTRQIVHGEREGRQSHALWRYIDDLYGPLDQDVDLRVIRERVDETPSSSKIAELDATSSWRDKYGLPKDKNMYPKTDSVLRELRAIQRDLENQKHANSGLAIKLLSKIENVEKESLKKQRYLSKNVEESYMCRRLGEWNVSKYEGEVKEYDESSDPRCHQCSRRVSELKDGNIMVSCTHDLSSSRSVRNTGCGFSSTCTKKFCTHCLDKVYQMKMRSTQRKWKCPHCRDGCFNFRCLRESRLDILRPRFYDEPTLSKTQTGTLKRASLVLKRQGLAVGLCGVCMRIEPVGENSSLVQCTCGVHHAHLKTHTLEDAHPNNTTSTTNTKKNTQNASGTGIGCRTFVHPSCARSINCERITEKNWLCEA